MQYNIRARTAEQNKSGFGRRSTMANLKRKATIYLTMVYVELIDHVDLLLRRAYAYWTRPWNPHCGSLG
jgi:hypothetical protein